MNKQLPVLLLLVTLTASFTSCSLLKIGKRGTSKVTDSTVVAKADTMKVVHIDTAKGVTSPVVAPVVTPTLDSSATPSAPVPNAAPGSTNAELSTLIERIAPIWTKRLTYKAFSGKAKVHVETPDGDKDFSAFFRVRKDSVIWVTVNLAGMSVARVFVTQDSIFMIDYYHKEAKCLPLSQIAKILPAAVDFNSLQNLVLGEPLVNGKVTNARYEGDSLFLRTEDTSYIQNLTYLKADSTIHDEALETHKPDGPKAFAQYSNYEMVNDRKISADRVLHVLSNGVIYTLEMNFTKMDFDGEQDYPFSIPNKYRN